MAVWLSSLKEGLRKSEIAERLGVSPQYVGSTLRAAEAKVSRTLIEIAEANRLQVMKVDPKRGILLGYHPLLKRRTVVTYTTRYGVKVWFWYDNPEREIEQTVFDEDFLTRSRRYLLAEAEERGLQLSERDRELPLAELADVIFRRLIPELEA
ncbi:MAG: hypothetical protein ACE5IJ_11470 [Thermoplasmata archaeon]